jgi:hypothetical protein
MDILTILILPIHEHRRRFHVLCLQFLSWLIKQISCRQYNVDLVFIHWARLYLLIGEFSPSTFTVINSKNLLLSFYCSFSRCFEYFCFSSLVYLCSLMIYCIDNIWVFSISLFCIHSSSEFHIFTCFHDGSYLFHSWMSDSLMHLL